ncbi:MAG: hypothetical protein NUV56_03490 [Candidatus Uhrbacteria bacterium]|nr:hypothetical protein [Candidatus Uhrbacteria bacterium]
MQIVMSCELYLFIENALWIPFAIGAMVAFLEFTHLKARQHQVIMAICLVVGLQAVVMFHASRIFGVVVIPGYQNTCLVDNS